MNTRVAVISIIVENPESTGALNRVLHDYSEQVKEQYQKLQKLEGFKFALFTISSLCSPIILILMILNLLHII